MTELVRTFLTRYGMLDPDLNIRTLADQMKQEMERGLRGEHSSYPMIPTYLKTTGKIPEGQYVAVIDAGGTNFRSALAHFENGRCIEERVKKTGMPGIGQPATWAEFISFVADAIEDLMPLTDRIGFCFSYSAEITPEIDGRVVCIDKEVTITGCEGQLVGESLCAELARRGYAGKRAVILNDTAAVQLGGMAKHLNDGYVNCFGQVSGTGTNTCCTVPGQKIEKLGAAAHDMIVNLEKMTAGVYLGEVCHLALRQAAEDGLFSGECAAKIKALPHVHSSAADEWACGKGMEALSANEQDAEIISEIAAFLFERSAKLMCANLTAMAELVDAGRNGKTAIFAEGSLVQRNHIYRPALTALVEGELQNGLGRDVELVLEEDTTLPGAAAAALLNLH